MIHRFSVRSTEDPELRIGHQRRSLGLSDLEVWVDYYIEFEASPSAEERALVQEALSDSIAVVVTVDEPFGPGTVSILHRRGVVDNECDSIIEMCAQLGLRARAGKVGRTYSSTSEDLRPVIEERCFNNAIEELHQSEPAFDTLIPAGTYLPAEKYDLVPLSGMELDELGRAGGRNLSYKQMQRVREIQERLGLQSVTDVLLEALDARWSDHCAHTTWRSLGDLLGRLVAASEATGNPNIVSMFEDNAGVWDFYDGYALALKAETHNGPSAISAYFGQLTKLGGVLRDILGTGQGADPIGCFEYTATGLPEDAAPTKGRPGALQIAHDTIQAIKEYGNTFGVPMMWSHLTFHPSYRAKPFALGGSVGLVPTRFAQRGNPQPGDLVILIGGLTGNDGMHGASASSAGSQMNVAAVQIGAPLEQVKFRKALIDLRDAGLIRALTDVGGAGLNSAVGEIGDPGGIWINTALVPLKTLALPMWRILLSESQERMVLAIPPEHGAAARAILDRHQVRNTVIGRFSGKGRYCVFHQPELDEQDVLSLAAGRMPADLGELGFDVPYSLLENPVERQDVGVPPPAGAEGGAWPDIGRDELRGVFEAVMADAEVASQRYADAQYDSTVQGNTVHGPQHGRIVRVASGYWAGTPLDGSDAAAVLTTAFNPWLFDLHPVRALRQQFVELLAKQVLAGVDRADICICDNFYTPHLSAHSREWLVAMVDELAMLVRHFATPVVSGKDSSAGSTYTDEGIVSVPPAVFLTALGKVPHSSHLLPETWSKNGSALVLLGPRTPAIAGTVAARTLDFSGGVIDDVSLTEALSYLTALADVRHLFRSGTSLGPGGLAARMMTGALASGLGVEIDSSMAGVMELFAEHRCGVLVEIDPAHVSDLPEDLLPVTVGRLTGDRRLMLGDEDLMTPRAQDAWATAFSGRLT